jgi:photosystem II stability/assembly factor-like uncharacterized protein
MADGGSRGRRAGRLSTLATGLVAGVAGFGLAAAPGAAATAPGTAASAPGAAGRAGANAPSGQHPPRVPYNPIGADKAFAALRGPGYEQALAQARREAATRPARALATAPASTSVPAPAWTPLGPAPITQDMAGANAGRVTGLALAPGSPQTIYAASAGGGVWSSANNGNSWATSTDSQPDIAMGAVAVDPSHPEVVFAGTGEDNECGDCFYGDGIMVSTNGGQSWATHNPNGMFTGVDVAQLAVEPGASSLSTTEVLAATSRGLYVSTDGGQSWAKETGTGWKLSSSNPDVTAVVVDANEAPVTIYAAVYGVGVERSVDNGATWTTVLPESSMPSGSPGFQYGAIGLYPGATATTTTLYVSVGSTAGYVGMWKSTDGGTSWSRLTSVPYFTGQDYAYNGSSTGDSGDQSWYDNVVAVDPSNPDVVLAGGETVVESADGGKTWHNMNGGGFFQVSTNLFHADIHALVFDSAGDVYIGCDGGVWELSAAGVASPGSVSSSDYKNLNTDLDITQFYPGVGSNSTATELLAGAQDVGTASYSASSSHPSPWVDEGGGDGGFSAIDQADPAFQALTIDGSLYTTTDRWQSTYNLVLEPCPSSGGVACYSYANFSPPFIVVSGSLGPTIYFGAAHVHRSTDGGASWATLPTYSGSDVSAIAVAPSNPQVVYAAWDDGTLQMSTNGGSTWATLAASGSGPWKASYITHISVNPSQPYTVYLSAAQTFPQYSIQAAHVYEGSNLATKPSWANLTGDLPAQVPVNSVIPDGSGGLIAATDVGVFQAVTLSGTSTTWDRLGTGLPNVQVMDVAREPNGAVVALTHGRGAWEIPAGLQPAPGLTPGAAEAPNHQEMLAVTRPDGSVAVATWFPGQQWSLATDIHGHALGGPAVVSTGDGDFDVFVRGTDNAVWEIDDRGGQWSNWWSLGGRIAGQPGAALDGSSWVAVVAVDPGGHIWERGADSTSGWWEIGGTLYQGTSPAAAAPYSGHLAIFGIGTDKQLWYHLDGSFRDLGGSTDPAPPGASSTGPGHLEGFVRGTNRALYHRWTTTSGWSAWSGLGGTLTSGPAVAYRQGSGREDVYALGTDGQVWHLAQVSGRWGRWSLVP